MSHHHINDDVAHGNLVEGPGLRHGRRPAQRGRTSSDHGGQTYYFCSRTAKAKFEADPTSYCSRRRGRAAPSPRR